MTSRSRQALTRWCALAGIVTLSSCATPLTTAGAHVFVVRSPLDHASPEQRMPECKLLATTPTLSRTEFDLEGQHDPFRAERNEAGAAGGNILVVRSRMVVSRRDFDCPASSPITDCPGTSGAWYDVVFESYMCPDEVAQALHARQPPSSDPSGLKVPRSKRDPE